MTKREWQKIEEATYAGQCKKLYQQSCKLMAIFLRQLKELKK